MNVGTRRADFLPRDWLSEDLLMLSRFINQYQAVTYVKPTDAQFWTLVQPTRRARAVSVNVARVARNGT